MSRLAPTAAAAEIAAIPWLKTTIPVSDSSTVPAEPTDVHGPLWARAATGTSVTRAETMSARSARRVTLAMTEPSGRGLGGSGRVQSDDRLCGPRSPHGILRKPSRRRSAAPAAAAQLLLEPVVGVGLAVEGWNLDEAAR